MPSSTEKQRRFMGAELQRKREGKPTRTKMSEAQLKDFAGSVKRRPEGSGPMTDREMGNGYRSLGSVAMGRSSDRPAARPRKAK